MKKANMFKNINLNNILDIMYEPNKDRYSVIEYNGSRKEITEKDYNLIMEIIRSKNDKSMLRN
jgi:hypothetical protein